MGFIVAIAHEKGGVGKTTLCTNLAVAAAMDGIDVVIVDADRMGSSRKWQQLRVASDKEPRILCYQMSGKFAHDLVEVAKRHQLVLVDCPGHDNDELRNAIAATDLLLMPMRPSVYDTLALETMLGLLRVIERRTGTLIPAYTVINAAATSTTETAEVVESLHADEEFMTVFPPLPHVVHDRVAFRRTARTGQSVLDGDPDQKARDELMAVYAATIRPLLGLNTAINAV